MKKVLALFLVMVLCLTMFPAAYAAEGEGEFDSALRLESIDWALSEDGSYYSAAMEFCTNIVCPEYQFMNIYVPAAYLEDGEVNGYTAETAPIIFLNSCTGWMSSTPGAVNADYIAEGFVFVSAGARSRGAGENGDSGKAPTPVVDLKSGIRMLRLNADLVPGDEDKIISCGTSGGGQMSSMVGATGNMDEYYAYLYENGAAGISKLEDGTYVSTIRDDVYACQCYCPIADLAHADLAYAWMCCGAGDTEYTGLFGGGAVFDDLQLELQNRLAEAYVEYINSLELVNQDGEALTADGVRSGSYYDQTLENISAAFNAFVENETFPFEQSLNFGMVVLTYNSLDELLATYTNTEEWLQQNEDGTYTITDLDAFVKGTALIRNKDIPGFDTVGLSEEGNAFGTSDVYAVHFSPAVAAVMEEMLADESVADLIDTTNATTGKTYRELFAEYIEQTKDEDVAEQVYLMNATQILLDAANGEQESDIAPYWRTRNGTFDEHTSFSVAYNLAMAAQKAGADVDYALVWGMTHGDAEGTSTGTFAEWVHEVVAMPPVV